MTEGSQREGRVIVLTGAAGGLGTAICQGFLEQGDTVLAIDRDRTALDRLVDKLGQDYLLPIEADVSSEESCRRMAAQAQRLVGHVDVVVNNAGVFPYTLFEDLTYEEWRRIISINLDGSFLVTSSVLSLMKPLGKGRIINISSGTVLLGTAGYSHYAAAKSGLIGFTRCLASELGDFGITANVVAPGLTSTEALLKAASPELLEKRRMQRAIRRHQIPEDIVGIILFLSSDGAGFITGQFINVDGGAAMH